MKNLFIVIFLTFFTICLILFFANRLDISENKEISDNQSKEIEKEENEQIKELPNSIEYINGVYIATVHNLDFPSEQGMTEVQLKQEIDDILQNCLDKGMTDIFLQVRPCADSLYNSAFFKPSIYITGSQDVELPFDVLEYYIEKSHELGLTFHAWINLYRITATPDDVVSTDHIAITNPELTIAGTDGNLYFNPDLEEVQNLILDGISEILENYDVDGIHFDDYFYPSVEQSETTDDEKRDNITNMIEQSYSLIKSYDDVVFGVSPFGIWANQENMSDGSDTDGTESYFLHYADSKKWVEMGILDYIAPQIYWQFGFQAADYQILTDWWVDITKNNDVDLYISHANYKEASGVFDDGEIEKQVVYNMQTDVSGSIYFRYEHIK